jgi:hypothetical protein
VSAFDLGLPSPGSGLRPPDKTHQRENQKNHEAYFGDHGCRAGKTAKAKEGRNEGDDEKDEGVVEHRIEMGKAGRCNAWTGQCGTSRSRKIQELDHCYVV